MERLRRALSAELGAPVWREENTPTDAEQEKRLWASVEQATGNPLLVHFVAALIERANVPARAPAKLARIVQLYSARKIKFFRERPERFQHPLRTIVWGLGDCDDKAIFIAAALRSFRIPVRLKFLRITMPDGRRLGHVYPLFWDGRSWIALESVREYPPGYDPEKKARARGWQVEATVRGDAPDTLHA